MTNVYLKYSDIPSDEPCWIINTKLWNEFCYTYELQAGRPPEEQWTEAEVTQWMDIFDHEMMKDNIYY